MKKILVLALIIIFTPTLTSATFNKDLKIGMKNNNVVELQKILVKEGYLEKRFAKGSFNNFTVMAVKKYQLKNNIPVTGTVGKLTRKKLNFDLENTTLDKNNTQKNDAKDLNTNPDKTVEKVIERTIYYPVYVQTPSQKNTTSPQTIPTSIPTTTQPVPPAPAKLSVEILPYTGNTCYYTKEGKYHISRNPTEVVDLDGWNWSDQFDDIRFGTIIISPDKPVKKPTIVYKIDTTNNSRIGGIGIYSGAQVLDLKPTESITGSVVIPNLRPDGTFNGDFSLSFQGKALQSGGDYSATLISMKDESGTELLTEPISIPKVTLRNCN